MNFCARVSRRNELDGVLVTLPPADADRSRQRVYALLQSLRSTGLSSAGVVASLGSLQARDVDECLSSGVGDFVFIEESVSARGSLGIIAASRLPTATQVRVRVWLTDDCRGAYQSHMAAWTSAFDFAVEVAPAPFALRNGRPVASGPLVPPESGHSACEWLRAVVTMTEDGSVIPCPAYASSGAPAVSANEPDLVMDTVTQWRGSLRGRSICYRCDRQIRFGVADWLGPPQLRSSSFPSDESTYREHVGRDASEAPPDELDRMTDEFTKRIDKSCRSERVR